MNTVTKPPYKATIGSISHGTMREEDLIPTFIDELRLLDPDNETLGGILDDIEHRAEEDDYFAADTGVASYDLNETLFEALNEYAPPFCYFGSHPGDGSDYGFWISDESIEEAVCDETIVKIDAGDEWPALTVNTDYVLEVTDHGNMTLFCRYSKKSHWAIV